MSRTPEQVEADNALTEAVRKAAEAYGVLSGAMLIDFMIICEGVHMERDREDFGILFMENRTRSTVAYGLIEKGSQLLQFSEMESLEEDEDG